MEFDFFPDRKREKCRKWDYNIIKQKFGDIPEDFIPMWIADMDFKIPNELKNKMIDFINIGVFGYTYCYDEFYNAVLNWQKNKHNVIIKKEEVILTYGTVSTLHYIIQAFCKKGDNIILNTPVYSPFSDCAKKQGVNVVCNSLVIKENRYYIDFDMLENQIKQTKPKIMLFCSPHNPSGRVWSKSEIINICNLCKKYNIILVCDEVHSENVYLGKHTSILSLKNELIENVIFVTSPNKAFNLGGLKTSYIVIKNLDLLNKLKIQLNKNSITSPNVFGILALTTVYNECDYWLKSVNEYIYNNYNYLKKYINNQNIISMMEMESSYLPFINIKNTNLSSKQFCMKIAKEKGVILEAGENFVKDGENFIRMNIGTQKNNLIEAITRLDDFIKNC